MTSSNHSPKKITQNSLIGHDDVGAHSAVGLHLREEMARYGTNIKGTVPGQAILRENYLEVLRAEAETFGGPKPSKPEQKICESSKAVLVKKDRILFKCT